MSGIIGQIFAGGASELVESVGEVLDKTITNKEEKMKAMAEIEKTATDLIKTTNKRAAEVLKQEAAGSMLQRNWRPVTMLMFVFIIVYSKFVAQVFHLPVPKLEPQFWELLRLGIGGYIAGRSVEKVASQIVSSVNLKQIKKKLKKQIK